MAAHIFRVSDNYHHPDLRPRLIAAARQALIERPDPAELSVRALARGLGVSANAPYRHFADRDDLLAAVVADGYRRLAADLGASGQDGAAPGASAIGRVWRRFAEAEPALALLLSSHQANDEVRAAAREWLAEVVRVLEPGQGEADPIRLIESALCCWAAVLGITTLAGSGTLTMLDRWLIPSAERVATRVADAAG